MRKFIILISVFLSNQLNAQSLLLMNNSAKITTTVDGYGFNHTVPNYGYITNYTGDYSDCSLISSGVHLKLAVNNGPASAIYTSTDVTHVNYTAFGSNAPLIKTKLLTGVLPAFDGSSTSSSVLHGVADYTKILSVNIEVSEPAIGLNLARTYPEEYTFAPGYQVSYFINGAAIIVINSNGNSFNVRNLPFKVYITYEQ